MADMTNKKQAIKHMKDVAKALSPHPVKVPKMKIELLDPTKFKDFCRMKNFMHHEDS